MIDSISLLYEWVTMLASPFMPQTLWTTAIQKRLKHSFFPRAVASILPQHTVHTLNVAKAPQHIIPSLFCTLLVKCLNLQIHTKPQASVTFILFCTGHKHLNCELYCRITEVWIDLQFFTTVWSLSVSVCNPSVNSQDNLQSNYQKRNTCKA